MKKILLTSIFAFIGILTASAQVGIGTETPKTTLQVTGAPMNAAKADGVQVPSLSLAQLDAKVAAYGSDQDGAIVYINDVSTTTNTPSLANINAAGFYFYDAVSETWKTVGINSTSNADGSETKVTAGNNVTVTGSGTTVSPYVVNSSISTPSYTVGLNAVLGGFVFYVTPDGKHGLVAATQDQHSSSNWYESQDHISHPANHDANGKKFTDWRLPKRWELLLMHDRRYAIGGFASANYWSSTEASPGSAWLKEFGFVNQLRPGLKTGPARVRAVRAF